VIPLLLALIVLAVALVCHLSMELVTLNQELRKFRQAEEDDMNRLDEWASKLERTA